MTVIPDGFSQATLEFTAPGIPDPAMVVIGLEPDPTLDALQQAQAVVNAWNTGTPSIRGRTHDETTLHSVRVLFNDNGVFRSNATFPQEAGTLAGVGLAYNCAYVISKETDRAGRAFHGRMYWPGLLEGDVGIGGVIDSAAQSSMGDAATNFLNALSSELVPMVLLHSDPAVAPTDVTGVAVRANIGTQRRRLS